MTQDQLDRITHLIDAYDTLVHGLLEFIVKREYLSS